MNRPLLQPLADACRGRQLKPTVILGVSTLALITWKYFGSPDFFRQHFAADASDSARAALAAPAYSFLAALVLMGVVPALIVKRVFHERLADYGVRWGNTRRTIRSILVCCPAVVLIAYFSTRGGDLRTEYPALKLVRPSAAVFGLHALAYLTFYLGWEFQFRGFMQHGLSESLGETNALLVQTMASVLVHIGKPASETYAAILAGLFWGVLAFRTRSLLSGLIQHFLLGVAVEFFLCFYP